jgi:hypothetical protein
MFASFHMFNFTGNCDFFTDSLKTSLMVFPRFILNKYRYM